MKDTGFYIKKESLNRLAKTYEKKEDGFSIYTGNHLGISHTMSEPPAFESGGAGLCSTVDDYAAFAQMLLNHGSCCGHQILKPHTVQFFTHGSLYDHQQAAFDSRFLYKSGYTYGNLMRVMVSPGHAGTLCPLGEYGWDGWLGPVFSNCPNEQLTFLFMTQKTDSGTLSVARKLMNRVWSEIV